MQRKRKFKPKRKNFRLVLCKKTIQKLESYNQFRTIKAKASSGNVWMLACENEYETSFLGRIRPKMVR